MADYFETGHEQEKLVLVAVSLDNDDMTDRSLDELEELDIENNMISNENKELKRRLSRKRVKKTKEDNDRP